MSQEQMTNGVSELQKINREKAEEIFEQSEELKSLEVNIYSFAEDCFRHM